MAVDIAEAGDDVDLLAERRDVIGRREYAAGKQFAILVAGRDHVFLGRLAHRQDVLILVDDGVADEQHAIVATLLDQLAATRSRPPFCAQRVEVLADMRLEHVEVAIDQLGRAERHLVGEMDMAAVRLDRLALERDLAGDVAFGILIVLALDVDARPDALDRTDRVGARH